MKFIKQSLVIILTIGFVFVIVHTGFSAYIAQILGFIIALGIIYIIIKRRKVRTLPPEKRDQEIFSGSYTEFFAITVTILLTIFLTEGFHSNLFFLVYFLLFGMTFMFEPFTVFIFMLGLIALFANQAFSGADIIPNVIRLSSLVLLSPIAFFFGREFKRREKLEEEIEDSTSEIISDAQKALKSGSKSPQEIKSIGKIVERSDKLRKKAKDI